MKLTFIPYTVSPIGDAGEGGSGPAKVRAVSAAAQSPLVMMFWARLNRVVFWLGACPDHAPAGCPIYLWGLLFLISFDQDQCAMLILHVGDAPLQEDLLPLPGGDVEELPSPLLPHLPDRCEEGPGKVGGFLNGVFRELLTDKASEEGGQVTVAVLRSRVSL